MKNFLLHILSIFTLAIFLNMLLPLSSRAAISGGLEGSFDFVESGIEPSSGVGNLGTADSFLATIIRTFLGLVAIIAVIVIIYGGVMYIMSLGDENKAQTAKHIILYAVIGLIIIGLAAIIVNFVINTLVLPNENGTDGGGGGCVGENCGPGGGGGIGGVGF